jgi:hypothetical protein
MKSVIPTAIVVMIISIGAACNISKDVQIKTTISENSVNFTVNNISGHDLKSVRIAYNAYDKNGHYYYDGNYGCAHVSANNNWSETWSDVFVFTDIPAKIKITGVYDNDGKELKYALVENQYLHD